MMQSNESSNTAALVVSPIAYSSTFRWLLFPSLIATESLPKMPSKGPDPNYIEHEKFVGSNVSEIKGLNNCGEVLRSGSI